MTESNRAAQDAPAAPPPLPPSGAFMPLVSIRDHRRLALTLMIVVAAIGAPLAWYKSRAYTYEVFASIYVAPRFAKVLKSDQELEFQSNSQYQQYVEQQVRNIGRYDIVRETLAQLGPYRTMWQPPELSERKAALRLIKALSARAIKNTYLISATLEGNQADGLAETLNTLLRVYLETMKKEDLYASDERLANLRGRQKTLDRVIQEKSVRRTELAELLGVTGFDGKTQNPYERLLQESSTALDEAHRKLIVAQAALDAYDPKEGAAARLALEAAALQIVANDSGLNSLKYHLWARRGELLNEISGLSPQHPLRAVAERKLRDLEQDVQTATTNVMEATRTQLLEQRRTALREARQVEQALAVQRQGIQERANWFITHFNEGMAVAQDMDRLQSQLNAVSERIDFLTLEAEAPGFLRLQSQALPPDHPTGGGPRKPVALALVAAIGLGLIVPVALDFTDRRIKTAAQAHRLLGFAPLAALLDQREAQNRLVWIDQMRRLTLALGQEKHEHDTRRIALTAVRAGGGVTGLILDLARGFARDGLRVIAVEANALKPDQRYMGGPLTPGLIDLLNGEATLDRVILPAEGDLPDRIPVGLALQRHLPLYDRFSQALDPLLERYDIVLLDTPPVLLSADTEYLARYADAMLLLVQARHTLPGEMKRAVRLLEKANPRVFGAIVTGLRVYKGGGYYAEMVRKYRESEEAANRLIQAHLNIGAATAGATETGQRASKWGKVGRLFKFRKNRIKPSPVA
ncbi:MAG: chain length determinant protein [Candidatus Competibacter sp.]|nr:chain length determinant protein [Candidatus Competibacter sp.]MDG4583304.1 chain length determinant protein [Candidatus Competibacter sp.]